MPASNDLSTKYAYLLYSIESICVLFAGAQKFKTFHFRTVLLSADDTLSVCVCGSNGNGISLWNYALSNISLKFCATEKRLGKAAYLFNIKTCRINITRWYFSCIFNFFLLCTIVAEKRRKSNLLVFTHNFHTAKWCGIFLRWYLSSELIVLY